MLAALPAFAGTQATLGSAGDELVLMHYMPWYETPEVRGRWGEHWTGFGNEADPDQTGADGLPDIFSNYFPLIGLYDSTDPHVLECQLLQMKLAGVDGVVADWYGLGQAVDYPAIHQATVELFNATAALDMQFAVCYEDRTVPVLIDAGEIAPTGVQAHLASTFAWMQSNWFTAPHYTRYNGRPLLLNFGPIAVTDGTTWDAALNALPLRPEFFALHNLWQTANADGAFMWVHWDAWEGLPAPAVIKQRLDDIFDAVNPDPGRVIASAVPGFDDVYDFPSPIFPSLPHRSGDTFRESLEVSFDGPWPIVQLVTWNDYGEGTMIEPTVEFGYSFLEILQEERASRIGPSFAFTADDLRLPARLLELRRAEAATPGELDAIAAAIRDGNIAAARSALAALYSQLITADPVSTVVPAGGTIVLSALLAAEASAFPVRWARDGQALSDGSHLSGAATETLTILNASADEAGAYALSVHVADEQVLSAAAIVGVRKSPIGGADLNNDGVANADDVLDFISLLEAAKP